MKRLLVLGLLVLSGCASATSETPLHKEPEFAQVPLQPARELYATIRTIAVDRVRYVAMLCETDKLPASVCIQLEKDLETLRALDFEITRALNNPKATLDTEKILKILEISAKLIGAVTSTPKGDELWAAVREDGGIGGRWAP